VVAGLSNLAPEEASNPVLRLLAETSTEFGRLVLLTSIQKVLLSRHEEIFESWLSRPLEEQYNDLQQYIAEASSEAALADSSRLNAFHRELIPPTARAAESIHYLRQMEILFDLSRMERGD
jgi:hypothetical protein